MFPVPCLLNANPYLLGYYRLLLGFSQKEFYTPKMGASVFKAMETKGFLSTNNQALLPELCQTMVYGACFLQDGITTENLSKTLLSDLTLLTYGPQLRGGANNKKGVEGIYLVFQVIHNIVMHSTIKTTTSKIQIHSCPK